MIASGSSHLLQGINSLSKVAREGGEAGGTLDDMEDEEEGAAAESNRQHLGRAEKLEESLALLWLTILAATRNIN